MPRWYSGFAPDQEVQRAAATRLSSCLQISPEQGRNSAAMDCGEKKLLLVSRSFLVPNALHPRSLKHQVNHGLRHQFTQGWTSMTSSVSCPLGCLSAPGVMSLRFSEVSSSLPSNVMDFLFMFLWMEQIPWLPFAKLCNGLRNTGCSCATRITRAPRVTNQQLDTRLANNATVGCQRSNTGLRKMYTKERCRLHLCCWIAFTALLLSADGRRRLHLLFATWQKYPIDGSAAGSGCVSGTRGSELGSGGLGTEWSSSVRPTHRMPFQGPYEHKRDFPFKSALTGL